MFCCCYEVSQNCKLLIINAVKKFHQKCFLISSGIAIFGKNKTEYLFNYEHKKLLDRAPYGAKIFR